MDHNESWRIMAYNEIYIYIYKWTIDMIGIVMDIIDWYILGL